MLNDIQIISDYMSRWVVISNKIRIVIYKKIIIIMIVFKYGILMTLLWLEKIELLYIKYKSHLIKNVCQKYDKFM